MTGFEFPLALAVCAVWALMGLRRAPGATRLPLGLSAAAAVLPISSPLLSVLGLLFGWGGTPESEAFWLWVVTGISAVSVLLVLAALVLLQQRGMPWPKVVKVTAALVLFQALVFGLWRVWAALT